MKRFILRFLLFLTPFIVFEVVELFVLPIDFFTFRVWESVKVDALQNLLPGYFYPRKTIAKVEEGDIGHHTALAVRKNVVWHTDRFGYRNRDEAGIPEVVIIGDSNTVGAGLTQRDVISEVLGGYLGVRAYSYAPASLNTFLRERRFRENRPRVIVVAVIEWDVANLRTVKEELAFPSYAEEKFLNLKCAFREAIPVQDVVVPLDRILKANMLHFSRASLRRAVAGMTPAQNADGPGRGPASRQGFMIGDRALKDVPQEQMNAALAIVGSYDSLLKKMGIRFIFLPIPNKENIYYDHFPGAKKPVFLGQLIEGLRKAGIETIDIQTPYDDTYRAKGPVVFQPDDSHWSALGVQIAARLLADAVTRDPGKNPGAAAQ